MQTRLISLAVLFLIGCIGSPPASADFWKGFAQGMADQMNSQNTGKSYREIQKEREEAEREERREANKRRNSHNCIVRGGVWNDYYESCSLDR